MILLIALALTAFDPPAEAVKLTLHHGGGGGARPAKPPAPKWIGKADGLKLAISAADAPDKVVATFAMSPRRKDTQVTHWDFSRDGTRVAVGAGDPSGRGRDSAGEVKVFDIASGKLLAQINDTRGANVGYVYSVQFTDDGTEVHVFCDEISGK